MKKKIKSKTKRVRRRAKAVWTKPNDGASAVHVTCVGAGGSGGSGKCPPLECAKPHMFFWKTTDQGVLRIDEMGDEHLLNARALVRRKIAKLSEVDEAMSRVIRKRHNRLRMLIYSDQLRKYNDAWEDFGQK